MPSIVERIVAIINYVFAVIFTIEAMIKIIANGSNYFKDNWNKFDFLIVVATVIGIILDLAIKSSVGG